MTYNRWTTLPAILVMVGAAMAGCLGMNGDDNETSPDRNDPGFGGNFTGNSTADMAVTVTIDSVGGSGNETGNQTGTGNDTGGNETGLQVMWTVSAGVTIDETAVVWSNQSVPNPENTTDYENSSEPERNVQPGSGQATIDPGASGTYYLRAYAIVNGTTYWSAEETADWEGSAAAGGENTVTITAAMAGFFSRYDPAELRISVGEAVVWVNEDNEAHTATADDGSFDTGEIPPGESSEPIVFSEPGEFDYYDARFPNELTVRGTIIVE